MKEKCFLELLAVLLLLLSACTHTRLSPLPVSTENLQLIESNHRVVSINVENPSSDRQIHGWQFMLFILPVGRVTVEQPLYHLERALINQFGLAGLKIQSTDPSEAQLIIKLEEVSVTAYDLLFTRRIVAGVRLSCRRQIGPESLKFTIFQKHAEFARYAFQKELTATLERAFDMAANSIVLECLEHRSL